MRGKHPNSKKNLKPYEKGESGNPSGRMKSFSGIKDELNKQVNKKHDVYYENTHKELIIEEIVSMAVNGDWKAIELLERLGCLE